MFDTVVVPEMRCSKCGATSENVGVQFKAYVGSTYSPQCYTVILGESLPGFPPIPELDDWGCWNCEYEDCDHLNEARVRLEAGRVVWVKSFDRDAGGDPAGAGRHEACHAGCCDDAALVAATQLPQHCPQAVRSGPLWDAPGGPVQEAAWGSLGSGGRQCLLMGPCWKHS